MHHVGHHASPAGCPGWTSRGSRRTAALLTIAVLALGGAREAHAQFNTFTPLPASVLGGSLPEAAPLLLSSHSFLQRTIAANDRSALNGGVKLGDNWDMITLNENGPQAGRYLFSPYETGAAGVKRLDLITGQSVTIVAEGAQGFVNGDASRWTPWGTYLTAEESWGAGSTKGRLFEVTNPLAAPASVNFVQRSVLPRVAHEGLVFDEANNLYFVDEFNGGAIYRYTSATPLSGATFFDAGQTSVLKVGDGSVFEGTGGATWVPITDAVGNALPGIPTVTIGNVTSVDGRAAADAVGATGLNRPEDLEIQTLSDGTQRIYFGTTDTHKVYSLTLTAGSTATLKVFADQSTIDAATGLAVGAGFLNPDNMAVDYYGNIYFTEDIGSIGGTGFDVWFGRDDDRDGVAESIGRWMSLSTSGAEPTGLYFSPLDPNVAYINVQHTNSDIDRTIEITSTPEPATGGLVLLGIGSIAVVMRRRQGARRRAADDRSQASCDGLSFTAGCA
ncbi:MAG: alkaline phosphatase PhoX [bacterium]